MSKNVANIWVHNKAQSKQISTSIVRVLQSITTMARVFGSIAHFELNIEYTNLANGPEIPYATPHTLVFPAQMCHIELDSDRLSNGQTLVLQLLMVITNGILD